MLIASPASAAPPEVGPLVPAQGMSAPDEAVQFASTFTDSDGYQDILLALFALVGYTDAGEVLLMGLYLEDADLLALYDQASDTWLGGIAPGTPAVIETALGNLDVGASSVSKEGNTLHIQWALTFHTPFSGMQYTYGYVQDTAGNQSPFVPLGNWIVNRPPETGFVSPDQGSLLTDTWLSLETTHPDPDGSANIRFALFAMVRFDPDGEKILMAFYHEDADLLFLFNQSTGSWEGGIPPGSTGIIETGLGALDASLTTVSAEGTALAINWKMRFTPSFTGSIYTFLYTSDDFDAASPFAQAGMWTVTEPWFQDGTAASGLTPLKGHAVLTADVDNDGDMDIYFAGLQGALFKNNGDATFVNATAESGLISENTWGAVFVDFDNDGDQDIYTASYGGPNRLYINDGTGVFVDTAPQAGVDYATGNSITATAADYNLDGWVDIYLMNNIKDQRRLYRNNHDGTFTDVSEQSGLDDTGWGKVALFVDINDDLYPDLYVVRGGLPWPSSLYRNNGDGTFTDIGLETNTVDTSGGYNIAFADYDRDGDFDFIITQRSHRLYRNDGSVFTVVEAGIGDNDIRNYGVAFADLDNDGWLDLVFTQENTPPRVLHNSQNGTFAEVGSASGIAYAGKLRNVAATDFDLDGNLDVQFVEDNLPPPAQPPLYLNRAVHQNGKYLFVRLVGTTSNRDGIGAHLKLTTSEGMQYQQAGVSVSNGRAQSQAIVHFGVGSVQVIDALEIRWPSGILQTLTGIEPNQTLVVTEPDLPNNLPALVSIGNQSTTEENELAFVVTATDEDEKDMLILSASNLPAGAAFEDHGNRTGTFSWTPNAGQAGIYPQVRFEVTDGEDTAFEEISIEILPAQISPPENAAEALDAVTSNMNQFTDFRADVIMTTELNGAAFADELYGTYYYQAPDRSRMEYFNEPDHATLNDIFISNGLLLSRVNPATMEANTTDLSDFSGLAASALSGMDYLHNFSDFAAEHTLTLVSVNETNKTCIVQAAPDGALAALYQKITLTIQYEKGLVLKKELMRNDVAFEEEEVLNDTNINGIYVPVEKRKTTHTASGDLVTHEIFSNVQLNIGLSPDLFEP